MSDKQTYDLFYYDEENDGLRRKRKDRSIGCFVDPIEHDVRGRGLVTIGDAHVRVEDVIARLKAFDPEDLRIYPDKKWEHFDDDWKIPTQARMKELFDYDRDRGVLIHKLARQGVKVGSVVGRTPYDSETPTCIVIEGFRTSTHRAVYLWHTGLYPYGDVRFRDGDKRNTRIENLYESSRQDTIRSSRPAPDSESRVNGVRYDPRSGKWMARLTVNGKEKHLGSFKELIDAVKRRWDEERSLNWPGWDRSSSAYKFLNEHDTMYVFREVGKHL
jgi:hypothetical protein